MTKRTPRPWHQLFGHMLTLLLEPVDITVTLEASVMSKSPVIDVLVLRNDATVWTEAQLERLPDGIRQSHAHHVLIEFKYSESINDDAMAQIISYDALYKAKRSVRADDVQSFIISCHSPRGSTLTRLGYTGTAKPGVYASELAVLDRILLISLNDLEDTPHNAAFKLFAAKRREKQAAYAIIGSKARFLGEGLMVFASFLYRRWFLAKGEQIMPESFTREDIEKTMAIFGKRILESFPAEERLRGLGTEERLRGLDTEERLRGLAPKEILEAVPPEDLFLDLSDEELTKLMEKRKRRNKIAAEP